MGEQAESIYDFEVVDEWSESEDPANEVEAPGSSDDLTNLKEDNKEIKKPTEGEIDAFLKNVKELVTSETSGLKAGSESLNSSKQNDEILYPTVLITNSFDFPNSSRDINLPRSKFNCSTSDFRVEKRKSTVFYKPGGTPMKTFFPEPSHSVNDDSSLYLVNQEQSNTSSLYSLSLSVKQIEDSEDDFSDNRDNDVGNSSPHTFAKQRSHIKNESRYRHRRSPEPSRFKKSKSLERPSTSNFPRERYNSRKEIFNERCNRDKRRLEDRRSRGRSRSRSRERRRHRRSRSKPRGSYLSLSPSPPRRSEEKRREVPTYNRTIMPNNVPPYYSAPPSTNPPFTSLSAQPNVAQENPSNRKVHFQAPLGTGPNLVYPMIQRSVKYTNYGGPMVQNPPVPSYSYAPPSEGYSVQGYQPEPSYHSQQTYQGYGPSQPLPETNSYQWGRPTPAYSATPSNPVTYYEIKGDKTGGDSSNNDLHWDPSASRVRLEKNEMLSNRLRSESPPRRKYSRSSSPESRKSHKRKSKKHSRSPDPYKSKSSRRHRSKHDSPDSDFRETKKKTKVVIDPDRIPTPPPPPILSNISNKSRKTSEKMNKSFERPLLEILDKDTVSLSCLLEAVMETSGQGKSQLSDPKVKTEILSQCETKIRQLYKRRIAGKGAFIPDPIVARQVNSRGSPLITFHPLLSYNEGPEKNIWRCPGIKVPPVKKIDPSDIVINKPAPICTLVSNPQPSFAPYMAQAGIYSGYESSEFQNVSDYSAWPGYGMPTAASTSFSDPSYNAWTGTYSTDGLWQDNNQQTAPTYEYKVATNPAQTPSTPENVSCPAEKKKDDPPTAERSPSLEPPPFTYRREPKRDLLLLAGKKSKKKKKKPPPILSNSPNSNSSGTSASMSMAKLSSDNPLNMPMNVVPSNNYSFEYVRSNPYYTMNNLTPNEQTTFGKEANEIGDQNFDNQTKLSLFKKEISHNLLKESKERLERRFSNMQRSIDTPQYEKDDRYNKEMSSLPIDRNIMNEGDIITIEDTDIRDSSLLKFNDSLNETTNRNSIGIPTESNKTQEEISLNDKRNHEREKYCSRYLEKTYDYRIDENLHNSTDNVRKNNNSESSVIEITSDSEDREKNCKDEDLNCKASTAENKLTIKHYYELGTEIRKIQEKSLSYKGIIECLQNGDLGYRRLYEFRNTALCKFDSRLKKLKIVIPRDYFKDLIVILHKKFHDVNQDEMFKSIKECTYPEILHVNKCILKVFSECPDCKLEPLKVEPLMQKTAEKRQPNKTKKKLDSKRDKSPTDCKKADENSKRRDSYSHTSTSSWYKGKRYNEDRESVDTSDGRPTGYEKATKSKFLPSKQNNNREIQNNLSDESKFRENLGSIISDTNDGLCDNNESQVQNEKLTEAVDEIKTCATVTMNTGLDFKSRVRNVQMKIYRETFHALESGEESKDTDETYLLKGGMLCKKIQTENGSEVKIVAPPSEIEEIIDIVHTMSSSHTPSPKVITFFSKHFTSVNDLVNKVNNFVNNCTQCNK